MNEKSDLSKIKLVALDLDGTLLDPKSEVNEACKEAIRLADHAGIEIVISTGRPYSGILPEYMENLPIRYCITTNGAAVYKRKGRELLYSQCLDNEQIAKVCEFLMTRHTHFDVFIGGDGYAARQKVPIIDELDMPPALKYYLNDTRQHVDDIVSFVRSSKEPVQKVTMNFPPSVLTTDREEVREKLGSDPAFRLVSGGYNNLEITRYDVAKSKALYFLCDYLGIPRDASAAVGDSENDLDIIRAAGLGVAMGNATPEVKDAADIIIEDNAHDGVALFLNSLIPS